jgi:hypothetical protein
MPLVAAAAINQILKGNIVPAPLQYDHKSAVVTLLKHFISMILIEWDLKSCVQFSYYCILPEGRLEATGHLYEIFYRHTVNG